MTELTDLDELLAHQLPEPMANVERFHPNWRESYFFVAHRPDDLGDMVILTMATFPQRGVMDSLQMGRVGGVPVLGRHERPHDGDPHTPDVGGARVEIVQPWKEIRLWADPDQGDAHQERDPPAPAQELVVGQQCGEPGERERAEDQAGEHGNHDSKCDQHELQPAVPLARRPWLPLSGGLSRRFGRRRGRLRSDRSGWIRRLRAGWRSRSLADGWTSRGDLLGGR